MTTQHRASTLPDAITPQFLDALRSHGITEAYLFGSVARGEADPESDLDLLVTFDRPLSLFARMDIADALSSLCERRVDLITNIAPAFAPYVEPTLIQLPL